LHGIGGAACSFAGQHDGLTDHTTIAWDAPGYGDSDDPAPSVTAGDPADRYADAAFAVLRLLGHERVHVLGVSWGGVIATRMALREPDRLLSLILADSTRGSGRTEPNRDGMRRRVEELATVGPRAFAQRRGPRLLAPGADLKTLETVVATMSHIRLSGYRGAAEMMASTDHSAELHRIRVPTLVIVGEHDQVTGVAESTALAAGISGAEFAVIPDGGHAVHQENPVAFNARVRQFLTAVDCLRP
jgi:pimeloyl-ACP methyl ester carboxylesterase